MKRKIPSWETVHMADDHLELAATFRGKPCVHLHGHSICHLLQLNHRGPTFLFKLLQYLPCLPPLPFPLHPPSHHNRRRQPNSHRRGAGHHHCHLPHSSPQKKHNLSDDPVTKNTKSKDL